MSKPAVCPLVVSLDTVVRYVLGFSSTKDRRREHFLDRIAVLPVHLVWYHLEVVRRSHMKRLGEMGCERDRFRGCSGRGSSSSSSSTGSDGVCVSDRQVRGRQRILGEFEWQGSFLVKSCWDPKRRSAHLFQESKMFSRRSVS